MAAGEFTAGSEVSVAVDSIVLPAAFVVDASAMWVALGEDSDIMDFMVIPCMGTVAALTDTTDAIIRLGLQSAKYDRSFEGHGPSHPR
jgi:hypothetical protein